MPSTTKYVPKHRDVRDRSTVRSGVRTTVVATSLAAAATGVAVGSGVLADDVPANRAQASDLSAARARAAVSVDDLVTRETAVSRSTDDRRTEADRLKQRTLSDASGVARTSVEKVNPADPRELARALMPEYGLRASEFSCLDRIWTQESKWNVHADNPHSSAYGIPQALPGSKMASAGPDWANSAETQIRWGLGYIRDRYGSACGAWGFKAGHGWY